MSRGAGTFSTIEDGVKKSWSVERLWALAAGLPVFDYSVERFSALDEDCWFCGVNEPTVRRVLEHAKRIEDADLRFPIVLRNNGDVMDGVHRICKALLEGKATVPAVQFAQDPTPDRITVAPR